MKTVKVRNLVIGEGKPKICVPLIGDAVSVLQTAEGVKKSRADLAEWRIDTDTDPDNEKQILQTAEKLRSILGDMPLLFTFRTKEEGGSAAISEERYRELNKEMICSGLIDLVDVEFFKMRATVESLVREAEAHRVRTVLSNHDFAKTVRYAGSGCRLGEDRGDAAGRSGRYRTVKCHMDDETALSYYSGDYDVHGGERGNQPDLRRALRVSCDICVL